MTTLVDEVTEKRCQTIKRDGYEILESYLCEKTKGGVVLGQRLWRKTPELKAFYFRPRSHRRYFKAESVTSHHERLVIRERVAKLLAAEKAAKVAPHDLKIGDIMACVWGVTMQNVRFYKVVKIPHPRKVTVAQINSRMASGDWMSGTAVPDEAHTPLAGTEVTYMVDMSKGYPLCKTGSSIDRMTRWDGNPVSIYSD
jgi:hypothetical protein